MLFRLFCKFGFYHFEFLFNNTFEVFFQSKSNIYFPALKNIKFKIKLVHLYIIYEVK
jgi:hypothetical protein